MTKASIIRNLESNTCDNFVNLRTSIKSIKRITRSKPRDIKARDIKLV